MKRFKGCEIMSKAEFSYGRFSATIKNNATIPGIVQAMFLYRNGSETPEIAWREIDFEILGKHTEGVQTNIIYEDGGSPIYNEYLIDDNALTTIEKVYTIEWTPDYIKWYVGGFLYRTLLTTENPFVGLFTSNMNLRFNTWVSDSVIWAGDILTGLGSLPAIMSIIDIKYYAYNTETNDFEGSPSFTANLTDLASLENDFYIIENDTWEGNLASFISDNVSVDLGYLYLTVEDDNSEYNAYKYHIKI